MHDLNIARYLHKKMSKNRVIIITGASGHLGEMAEEFKKLNYKLILVDKNFSTQIIRKKNK